VEVDAALGDPGTLADGGHRRPAEALLGERLGGGDEETFAQRRVETASHGKPDSISSSDTSGYPIASGFRRDAAPLGSWARFRRAHSPSFSGPAAPRPKA